MKTKERKYTKGLRELKADDIIFEDEILFMDDVNGSNVLNFYLAVWFDPDEVFGTNVSDGEGGDSINLYVNYDIDNRCVADILDIILDRSNGSIEYLSYKLSDAEKELILNAMEAYCMDYAGQTIEGYINCEE